VTTTTSPPVQQRNARLADRLDRALDAGGAALTTLIEAAPADRHDRFVTLLAIYDLRVGPWSPYAEHAEHPALAALKWRLEREWVNELGDLDRPAPTAPDDVVRTLRGLAARDRLPAVYKWLAEDASWSDVVRFLALEGGPDGGFDDLVAVCQLGLTGSAKLELATNYWDEMGNGDLNAVHTTLHTRLATAIRMPAVPRIDQPESALERAALGGLLATNRGLQPEMLGALGLTELQAGPRCRMVLRALDRCGAPEDAYPFYREHADVDPRHGKDWMDNAIGPVVAEHPDWAAGILRGAWWRSRTNAAFFADAADLFSDQAAA
jgi:hypothetical protein